MRIPCLHVNANWMALLPAPQNPSIIKSQVHLSATKRLIFSGVTEYQLSKKKNKNDKTEVYIQVYVGTLVYITQDIKKNSK